MLNGKLTAGELEMLAEKNGRCWLEEKDKRERLETKLADMREARAQAESAVQEWSRECVHLESVVQAVHTLVVQAHDLEFHQLRKVLVQIEKITASEMNRRMR